MAKIKHKVENAEVTFKKKYMNLFIKAEKSGFDAKDFVYCEDKKNKSVSNGGKLYKNYVIVLLIIISFVTILYYLLILYHQLVSDLIAGYFKFDLNERCLIPVFTSLLAPPVDCSVCKNIKSIEKISNISREDFENVYAYSGVPVIITDATENWTATHTFSYKFFSDLYLKSDLKLNKESNICQFFPYGADFKNLSDFLSRDISSGDNTTHWYVGWGSCDSDVSDGLRQHYSKPYFLPEHSESSRIDWIFMGRPGFGTPLHLDHVSNPSWQAQIKGSKLWTLEPPYECYFECERSLQVIVNAGEIIVLDTDLWFHGTEIVGDEISITIGSEYD